MGSTSGRRWSQLWWVAVVMVIALAAIVSLQESDAEPSPEPSARPSWEVRAQPASDRPSPREMPPPAGVVALAPSAVVDAPPEATGVGEPDTWFSACDGTQEQLTLRQLETFELARTGWPRLAWLGSRHAIDVASARIARAPESRPDLVAMLQLAMLLGETTRLDEARAMYQHYLAFEPGDGRVARRVKLIDVQRKLQARFSVVEAEGITVWFSPELLPEQTARGFAKVARDYLDEAAMLIRVPARRSLTIVIYSSLSDVLAATCVPPWAGGVFDGSVRLVAATNGINRRSVRHELLHAQMSPLAPHFPRWFSEGMAEFFEDPLAPAHGFALELVEGKRSVIPFDELAERLRDRDSVRAGVAYAQAGLMIRWIIDALGDPALAEAVQYLASGGNPAGLLSVLDPSGRLDRDGFETWLRSKRP